MPPPLGLGPPGRWGRDEQHHSPTATRMDPGTCPRGPRSAEASPTGTCASSCSSVRGIRSPSWGMKGGRTTLRRMAWTAARSLHGGTLCAWAKRRAAARMYSRWVSCGRRAPGQPGWSTNPPGQSLPTLPRGGDGGASPPPPAIGYAWAVPSSALADRGTEPDPAQDLADLHRLRQKEHSYSLASIAPLAQASSPPARTVPGRGPQHSPLHSRYQGRMSADGDSSCPLTRRGHPGWFPGTGRAESGPGTPSPWLWQGSRWRGEGVGGASPMGARLTCSGGQLCSSWAMSSW